MSNLNESYSIILPTYNEVGHIEKLVKTISNIFINRSLLFEIIIVDDNSVDGTIDVIKKISKEKKEVISIIREGKKGSLVDSINDGIEISKSENVIWLDADFSHPPKYIEEFINYKKNIKDIDVIVFSRFLKKSIRYYEFDKTKASFIDFLSILLNKLCKFILFDNFTDYTSGYICIKKDFIKDYKLEGHYGDYFINLITDCYLKNKEICELPFLEERRYSGVSKTTFNKLSFMVKCYFYIIVLIKNKFKIILK